MSIAITAAPAIERRHGLEYSEFVRDYLERNKPVILCGAMDRWPALAKWSPEFFKTEFGSTPVNLGARTRTLGEFIDLVLASTPDQPAPYLKDAVVRRLDPRLLKDIEPFAPYAFPNWLQGFYPHRAVRHHLNAAQVELFVGGQGTRWENCTTIIFTRTQCSARSSAARNSRSLPQQILPGCMRPAINPLSRT